MCRQFILGQNVFISFEIIAKISGVSTTHFVGRQSKLEN